MESRFGTDWNLFGSHWNVFGSHGTCSEPIGTRSEAIGTCFSSIHKLQSPDLQHVINSRTSFRAFFSHGARRRMAVRLWTDSARLRHDSARLYPIVPGPKIDNCLKISKLSFQTLCFSRFFTSRLSLPTVRSKPESRNPKPDSRFFPSHIQLSKTHPRASIRPARAAVHCGQYSPIHSITLSVCFRPHNSGESGNIFWGQIGCSIFAPRWATGEVREKMVSGGFLLFPVPRERNRDYRRSSFA